MYFAVYGNASALHDGDVGIASRFAAEALGTIVSTPALIWLYAFSLYPPACQPECETVLRFTALRLYELGHRRRQPLLASRQ